MNITDVKREKKSYLKITLLHRLQSICKMSKGHDDKISVKKNTIEVIGYLKTFTLQNGNILEDVITFVILSN